MRPRDGMVDRAGVAGEGVVAGGDGVAGATTPLPAATAAALRALSGGLSLCWPGPALRVGGVPGRGRTPGPAAAPAAGADTCDGVIAPVGRTRIGGRGAVCGINVGAVAERFEELGGVVGAVGVGEAA